MAHITVLSESKDRELLIGAVQDSFSHPVEVLAKEKEVSELIDKIYSRCVDADEKALKETMDSLETDEEKKAKEKETKSKDGGDGDDDDEDETKTKDTGAIVEAAIAKSLAGVQAELKRVTDSIPAQVEAAVAKALGVEGGKGKEKGGSDNRTVDSGGIDTDNVEASFLLNDVFGK